MEDSGHDSHRESDNKVDSSTQYNFERTNMSSSNHLEVNELMEDLRLVREQLASMKAEAQELKAHNTRKFNGYKAEYNELLVEKNSILEELMKTQSEKDIALEIVSAMEKSNEETNVDECIIDSRCDGDCEHVGCNTQQLQRLKTLKEQGGKRSSPAEAILIKHCPQCNFTSRSSEAIKQHVNSVHVNHPSCPFCQVGFHNLQALRRHIDQQHSEDRPAVKQTRPDNRERPCIFFLQPRGCKKGSTCDFSHTGVQQRVMKVRKFCRNGPGCQWKPRCMYVHPEDGETLPDRATREEGRRRQWSGSDRHTGGNSSSNQGFGNPDFSQTPPGYSMTEFPGLGQPERPTVIKRLISQ